MYIYIHIYIYIYIYVYIYIHIYIYIYIYFYIYMGVSLLLTTNWYAPPSKEIVGLLHFAQVLMLYPFVHLEHRVPHEAQ